MEQIEFKDLLKQAEINPCLWVYFDIETQPAKEKILKEFYDEGRQCRRHNTRIPEPLPPFDESFVKTGHLVDPKKIEDKIEKARKEYSDKAIETEAKIEQKKKELWQAYVDESPLKWTRNKVISIGYGIEIGDHLYINLDINQRSEPPLLERWNELLVRLMQKRRSRLISFNGDNFDIPVLTQRCWVNKIDTPYIYNMRYRRMEDISLDLAPYIRMGCYKEYVSLDEVARALKIRGKEEGMTGAIYWKVLKENPDKAKRYLESDIRVLWEVCKRIGVGPHQE